MRILLYVPLNPGKPRIHPSTWESINSLSWDKPLDIALGREDCPQEQHRYENLTKKHNCAKEMALRNGYDAVFFVEADMIVPPNALQRMTQIQADVVYGLYCSRHDNPLYGRHRWLAHCFDGAKSMTQWTEFDRDYIREKVWAKVRRSHGLGMGCTLIHRNVLESLLFRSHPQGRVADDLLFAQDVHRLGFMQAHDFGVVCGHILANGQHAVWPDVDADLLYRVEEIA